MPEALEAENPRRSAFRLLVRSTDEAPPGSASIEAGGSRWRVMDAGSVPSPASAPKYVCVSYSWGKDQAPNPFDPEQSMSARAMSALEAAIATWRPAAIWLDAACMPRAGSARILGLQSMGAIYAAARAVLAVLSSGASAVLDAVRRNEAIAISALKQLEEDEWISRAWTYQEIINSRKIGFVAEGQRDVPVRGVRLLNAVGHAIGNLRKAERADAFQFRARHPRLDALETLIEDWLQADHEQRSAYRVMAGVAGRTAREPEDLFYAMIGAITTAPGVDRSEIDPAEYFMRVCERKGDFSFIYAQAPRDPSRAGGWRPAPGPLDPLIPWASNGERQKGELHPEGLRLHDMAALRTGSLAPASLDFVRVWLQKTTGITGPPSLQAAVRDTLKSAGFSGCGPCTETAEGFFFAQGLAPDYGDPTLFVARDISFNFGAPGLVAVRTAQDKLAVRDVGILVGPPPTSGATITLG